MNETEYTTMYEAEDTHWWYVSLHALILEHLLRLPHQQRILDAGCGTGRLLQLLSAHGAAEGCDFSESALSLCKQRGLTALLKGDLNTMPLPRDCYDVITSIDVLYHRDIKDDEAVLRKIFTALRPGGRLILQVPAYEWLRSAHDVAVHTGRRYTRKRIKRLLNERGFLIEKATYRVTLLFGPLALMRLAGNLLRKCRGRSDRASDVEKHSAVVNALLLAAMKTENRLLKHCSLPFGASVFAVARKPDTFGEKKG